jgi:hypothetical protein
MPPLEQSLSSSQHSVGSSSSKRIFARVRHNLALSPSRNAKPFYTSTININNASTTSTMNFDSELRTAKDACVGAMMALLHYLSQHSISSGTCVHELHQTIPQSSHYQYDLILRRIIQQYVMKLSTQIRCDEFEIIHMLVLGCWQAQHRFAQLHYQTAYRHYQSLRFSNDLQQSQPSMKVAPTVNISGVVTINNVMNVERNLKTALHHQIQMAEYVCTCQKEIILCNRTYEYQQEQSRGQ